MCSDLVIHRVRSQVDLSRPGNGSGFDTDSSE
jgi:hypothetical protein